MTLESGERGGYGTGLAGRQGGESSQFVSHEQLSVYLRNLSYPARKQDVVNAAFANEAPRAIIEKMERLPDQVYSQQADVENAFQHGTS